MSSLITFISIIILLALVLELPRFKILERTINYIRSDGKEIVEDGAILRLQIWKASFTIIKENPVFGVGIGDVNDELTSNYREKELVNAISSHLNAHNQLIETFLGTGIIGVIVLIGFLIIPLFLSKLCLFNLSTEFKIFLIIIFVHFLFESVLLRYNGISFFALFYCFFMLTYPTYEN